MFRKFLCKIGIHKYILIEVHYGEYPNKKIIKSSIMERCSCGFHRFLRDEKPTEFILSTKFVPRSMGGYADEFKKGDNKSCQDI